AIDDALEEASAQSLEVGVVWRIEAENLEEGFETLMCRVSARSRFWIARFDSPPPGPGSWHLDMRPLAFEDPGIETGDSRPNFRVQKTAHQGDSGGRRYEPLVHPCPA